MQEKQIKVDINDKNSIKSALDEYLEILRGGEGTRDDDFCDYSNVIFSDMDGEALNTSSINNSDLIESIANYYNQDYHYSVIYFMENNEELTKYEVVGHSEDLFIAFALCYPELKEDVVAIAKEIVNISRKHNDTIWYDSHFVFGFGTLFFLSSIYDEYSYLMGAYMIQYWDEEHAGYVQHLMINYCKLMGIYEETLKIFAYCDNYSVRMGLFNSAKIKEYFIKNPQNYEFFKNTLKERFKEYDYIQRCKSEFEKHPIDSFYKSLLLDEYGDRLDVFSEKFVYDNADIEARELENEIIEYIGKPLVVLEEKKDPYEKLNYYIKGEATNEWKEFITEEFKNGEQIWSYIINGENSSVLENIKSFEPNEIFNLFKNSDYELKTTVTYYSGSFQPFEDNLYKICSRMFRDFYDEEIELKTDDLDHIEEIDNGNGVLVRFIDFIHKMIDEREFQPKFLSFATERYQLISEEDFHERYSKDIFARVYNKFENQMGYDDSSATQFVGIYEEFCELKKRSKENAIGLIDKLSVPQIFRSSLCQYLFISYILKMDIENGIKDEVTEHIISLLEEKLIGIATEPFESYISHNPDLINWDPIFKMNDSEIQEKAKELQLHFNYNNYFEGNNFYTELITFNDYGHLFRIVLMLSTIDKDIVNLKNYENLKLIFLLFLYMAPIKVIKDSSYLYKNSRSYNDYGFKDGDVGKKEFINDLKRMGVPEEYINAWEVFSAVQNRDNAAYKGDYEKIIHEFSYLYGEDNGDDYNLSIRAEKLYNSLKYVDTKEKICLLRGLNQEYNHSIDLHKELRKATKSYLMRSTIKKRKIFLEYNEVTSVSKEDIIEKFLDYVDGNINLEDIKEFIDIFKDRIPSGGKKQYKFSQLLKDLDVERRYRLVELYLAGGVKDIENHLIKLNDLDNLEKIYNICKKHDIYLEKLIYKIIRYESGDIVLELDKYFSIVEFIKEQDLDRRLELIKLIAQKDELVGYLVEFKDDESRDIQEFLMEYIK